MKQPLGAHVHRVEDPRGVERWAVLCPVHPWIGRGSTWRKPRWPQKVATWHNRRYHPDAT